jgi:hypothetical protein
VESSESELESEGEVYKIAPRETKSGRISRPPKKEEVGGKGKRSRKRAAEVDEVVMERPSWVAPAPVEPVVPAGPPAKVFESLPMDPPPRKYKPKRDEDVVVKWQETYHGPGTIFCASCGRGHSPLGNRIVLCDECNRPYHQKCHAPEVGSRAGSGRVGITSFC